MKTQINKTIKSLLIIALAVTLFSCNDENININDTNDKTLSITDYLKVISLKADGGKVLIQSSATVQTQNNGRISSINSSFDRNTKTRKSFILTNKKTGETINKTSKNSSNVEGYFGQTYSYNIGDTKDPGGEVYIPELISAEFSTETIQVGTTVTWNIDPLNENGVAVWYEYSPFKQSKYSVVDENRENLANGFVLPETTGSYTFTSSDLSQMPNDAVVTINVSRAGFGNSNEQVIVGLSSVSKDVIVQK